MGVAVGAQAIASQLVKVWLPQVLAASGTLPNRDEGVATFAAMWGYECMGIIGLGVLLGAPGSKGGNDTRLVLVAMAAFFAGSLAVVTIFVVKQAWMIGVLGGVHLLGQACAFNFLFAF